MNLTRETLEADRVRHQDALKHYTQDMDFSDDHPLVKRCRRRIAAVDRLLSDFDGVAEGSSDAQ